MKTNLLWLYFLLAVITIVAQTLGWKDLHHWAKPFLMLSLLVYYIQRTNKGVRSAAVIVALLFSFLGDSFLLYEHKEAVYFMLGLGSFLIAHVIYILAYRQHVDENNGDELTGVHRVRSAFPIVMAGSGLVVVLFPRLGELKLAVTIYSLVMILMVLNALFRYNRTGQNSFRMVFVGALLFMISDGLLAINKFLMDIPLSSVWIMSTYVFAQFLIVEGLIAHWKSGKAIST